jgi:hypothetical protein
VYSNGGNVSQSVIHESPTLLNIHVSSNQGVGLGYTQTLFQGLATAAGYDPVAGPGSSCLATTASGQCVVPWGSGTKSVSSVVLTADGVSFAIMTAILTTIGSAADYGTFGWWLLFVITVVCWVAQYACMALTSEFPGAMRFLESDRSVHQHRTDGSLRWFCTSSVSSHTALL